MSQNKKVKFIAIAIFVVLFILFNLRNADLSEPNGNKQFNDWLTRVELPTTRDSTLNESATLSLELYDESTGEKKILSLSTSDKRDQSLRILELAKEAHNFLTEDPIEPNTIKKSSAVLYIKGTTRNFYAMFTKKDIEENAPVKTLLKLFQIYTNS